MTMLPDMAVAILAGGASRRMGRDKAALDWGGQPLLRHLLEVAREAGAADLAVVGGEPAPGSLLAGTVLLSDTVAGRGPVGGLLAALRWRPCVLVAACDMPGLSPAWLRWLWQRASEFPGWTLPESQPLCAVYTRALVPWLERNALDGDVGSLTAMLAAAPRQILSRAELDRHGFSPDVFLNVNTPREYVAAQAARAAQNGTNHREPQRLRDSFGRRISDLRISVTERCNYRCVYCRYGADNAPVHEPLSWPELERLARVFAGLGIRKFRLTGGEPLVRDGLVDYVRYLSQLRLPPEAAAPAKHIDAERADIAITTNGHLLAEHAAELKRAGLTRVTVSLDSLQEEKFAQITRVRHGLARVLDSIAAAQDAGLQPVKINCVLLRGRNDDEIEAFAAFARERALSIRFIEFMPLEQGKLWQPEMVVPMTEVLERIKRVYPLQAVEPKPSETARRWRFADGAPGEIGIIAPVSTPFCNQCSRIRLTADGKLRTCLFSLREWDLRPALAAAGDDELSERIQHAVWLKEERHHIGEPGFVKPARSMVHIGG